MSTCSQIRNLNFIWEYHDLGHALETYLRLSAITHYRLGTNIFSVHAEFPGKDVRTWIWRGFRYHFGPSTFEFCRNQLIYKQLFITCEM